MLPNYPFVLSQASLPTWPTQPSTLTPLGRLQFSETHLFPKLQMGLRHRPLLLSCVHAQSCLTLCDPMDCSPPGSFCPWDAQIPQINVVGCGGVESPPTSCSHSGSSMGRSGVLHPIPCSLPTLLPSQGTFSQERLGRVCLCVCVCVCVCHEFFRVCKWPVELHMGKKYLLTV